MHTVDNASRDLKTFTVYSPLITLSAAASTNLVFFNANRDYKIRSIHVLYNVATDANAGVALNVGTRATPAYFATLTSEVSKAIDTVTAMTLAQTTLAKNTPLMVNCAGTKTGVGQVLIAIELQPIDTVDSAGRKLLPT